MIIGICSFSKNGMELAQKLNTVLPQEVLIIRKADEDTDDFVKTAFEKKYPLVFIGACGIAVRKIAPYVSDKLTDIPVIVIDEKGKYVIPILSGHVGGGNRLAGTIAKALNAEAVYTTGTDVEGLFAIDVFAYDKGFNIINREGIKKVSSKLLAGKSITVAIDENAKCYIIKDDFPDYVRVCDFSANESQDPGDAFDVVITDRIVSAEKAADENPLYLKPKHYSIGIGCKAGTSAELISQKVSEAAESAGLSEKELIEDAFAVSTIDLKKKETGLLQYVQINKLSLITYSAEELEKVQGDFPESEFVKSITGVSNVCERAAVLTALNGTSKKPQESYSFICRKYSGDGVTVAVVKR